MKKNILPYLFIACSFGAKAQLLPYPVTQKIDHKDTYFGTVVEDPYHWLEDDKSKETAVWVRQQNEVTFDYISKIPYREKIKNRLTELWNFAKYSTPTKKGKNYFFTKNDGIQNQSVIYMQEGISGTPKLLLDPNKLSADGTTSVPVTVLSKDGKYMAYQVAKAGSDWIEIYVMDITTGQVLGDHLEWIKFSGIAWEGNGFYYSRYAQPDPKKDLSGKNEFHKIYYHKLGTDQSADRLVYEDKNNPQRNFGAATTEDEDYLFLSEMESSSKNSLWYKDLKKPNSNFIQLAKGFTYDYDVIDNIGNKLLIKTNDKAPKNRLMEIDLNNPDEKNWKEIIPEQNEVLQGVTLAGNKIVAQYTKDAYSKIILYSRTGKREGEVALPGIGNVKDFFGYKDDNVAFYSFVNFTTPTCVYKYDVEKNTSEIFFKPSLEFNPADYETKQVFYPSKDGTKVPMFITYKKGLVLDGTNPTLLYGYGGFNISINPIFYPDKILLLENGGVFALANIRGGSEYGEAWHEAGTKLKKQNVFDDFIAAAEYLIKEKYTSSSKLAIQGRSNGGLLVGACMTQRPGLFKVALPNVGVMDMLRFHTFTIGWAWKGDYGSSEDSTQFKYLLGYSPLHNIKPGINYPATMVTTADHDDRVVPAHSFKFISTLQEKHKGDNPVLIRVDVNAGHGAGKPINMQINEAADVWAFTFYNLGVWR